MLLTAYKALPRPLRQLLVLVIGGTVLLIGVAMVVTPGPAMLVIPVGLAILSAEFVWAKRLLTRYKSVAAKAVNTVLDKVSK